MSFLQVLKQSGFDESYNIPLTKRYKVKCSQCEALCINNYPTHERGCPNQRYECKGCNATLDYKGYCQDCQ
jgi:hypothetical protein